ncbi:transposable element Tcb1 transposase [Trichonephila clavipes]|nr:transposable element Tcb1 transposase [Trichonephila clavipes]
MLLQETDALEDGGKLLQREKGEVVERDQMFGRDFRRQCVREKPERVIVRFPPWTHPWSLKGSFSNKVEDNRDERKNKRLRKVDSFGYPTELEIAQSVISRLWQRFQDDGNVSRCYSTGRPRVTTPSEDRYLAVTAKRNRRSTASDLSRLLSSATGKTVSRPTVHRRLGHIGLYARRPVRCVPLTATHCHLQLTWSRDNTTVI